MRTLNVGIGAVDSGGKWLGGKYYLHHLIRCVQSLPASERTGFIDVYWKQLPVDDAFAEVRPLMAGREVLAFPDSVMGRASRRVRRSITHSPGIRDLLAKSHIDVLFPIPLSGDDGIPLAFWLPDFQYRFLQEAAAGSDTGQDPEFYAPSVEKAAIVVLSSNHSLKDFRRVFPAHVAKARILHFCSVPDPSWWELDPEEVARVKQLPERFFLMSNELTGNKNQLEVFEAVRLLKERNILVNVVCTGRTVDHRGRNYHEQVLRFPAEAALTDQIFILGMLPRAEQIALMRRSLAILQPSRFEGWSTAVEDSRTLGKLILASDIEVHREQLGESYEWYAPLDDVEAWAAAIERLSARTVPGPEGLAERDAAKEIERRMLETGQTFVRIMNEAVRTGSRSQPA